MISVVFTCAQKYEKMIGRNMTRHSPSFSALLYAHWLRIQHRMIRLWCIYGTFTIARKSKQIWNIATTISIHWLTLMTQRLVDFWQGVSVKVNQMFASIAFPLTRSSCPKLVYCATDWLVNLD